MPFVLCLLLLSSFDYEIAAEAFRPLRFYSQATAGRSLRDSHSPQAHDSCASLLSVQMALGFMAPESSPA